MANATVTRIDHYRTKVAVPGKDPEIIVSMTSIVGGKRSTVYHAVGNQYPDMPSAIGAVLRQHQD